MALGGRGVGRGGWSWALPARAQPARAAGGAAAAPRSPLAGRPPPLASRASVKSPQRFEPDSLAGGAAPPKRPGGAAERAAERFSQQLSAAAPPGSRRAAALAALGAAARAGAAVAGAAAAAAAAHVGTNDGSTAGGGGAAGSSAFAAADDAAADTGRAGSMPCGREIHLHLEHPTRRGAPAGTLLVRVAARPAAAAGPPRMRGPVRCRQNLSVITGVVLGKWGDLEVSWGWVCLGD